MTQKAAVPTKVAASDVVSIELPLGTDHFGAEMISSKCAVEGIRHELMAASSLNPYSVLDGDPHRLLVAEADVAAARQIIASSEAAPASSRRHSRPQRMAALSLVALVLGPVIVAAISWVLDII